MRCSYIDALEATDILRFLREFQPRVAGTPPLGVDIETSDIDILCHAPDPYRFCETLWEIFEAQDAFKIWQWTGEGRAVLASFRAHGWEFEIFGGPEPVERQRGWRHFEVERRLLLLGGLGFRDAVRFQRQSGIKTEPAFWIVLGQDGDPYQELLGLYDATDQDLLRVLARAGY
ncbi:DUF4269 domain-containing protein [Rhizobium mesoamericanum]|uniref:DUF4269 domain-containing protein n=1 Tax=Rhizobium mesoamericanum TaxID=1079800 RepID=UPI0027D8A01C|nr:DUF4269 domain-containing protein [Rhizobium mesoamericanum]